MVKISHIHKITMKPLQTKYIVRSSIIMHKLAVVTKTCDGLYPRRRGFSFLTTNNKPVLLAISVYHLCCLVLIHRLPYSILHIGRLIFYGNCKVGAIELTGIWQDRVLTVAKYLWGVFKLICCFDCKNYIRIKVCFTHYI